AAGTHHRDYGQSAHEPREFREHPAAAGPVDEARAEDRRRQIRADEERIRDPLGSAVDARALPLDALRSVPDPSPAGSPAALGSGSVPMKPLAPVTRTPSTPPPHPALLVELVHLLLGEAGPAVARVVHHDVAEARLRLPQPPELPEAEADVVVALGHPDGGRE